MEGIKALNTAKINCLKCMVARLDIFRPMMPSATSKYIFHPKTCSLRFSPYFSSSMLHKFDFLKSSIQSKIANTLLSDNDPAGYQEFLPVKSVSLVIRSALTFASSTFFLHLQVVLMIPLTRFFLTAGTMLSTLHLRKSGVEVAAVHHHRIPSLSNQSPGNVCS